jgi:O-succinylbenzoic acid--CoA ligase
MTGVEIHPLASTLLNTSGSTGFPKFVQHKVSQHFLSAVGVCERMAFDATQSWLLSLPLYHVGGLAILVRALHTGASIVVPSEGENLSSVLQSQRVTHVSLVATQLKALLADEGARDRLSACRRVMLGGGPVPTWLESATKEYGIPVVASYGATEMASAWTAGDVGSGKLIAGRELKVHDGEICVRGPMLFKGYVGAAPIDEDGYYHTGDLGYLDADANLHVLGRKDNMFISGGENIHPQEIELALLNHPSIQQVVVVDVPDAKWGARPMAFVKWGARTISDAELKCHLRDILPSFKIPDRFFDWPEAEDVRLKPSRERFRQLAAKICA